jgi:spermidine synthase
VVNADALQWLEESREYFDFIVIDFPDPANFALGKLYTSAFYRLLEKRLSAHGLLVVQSTSPLYARQSFWCVVTTLEDRRLQDGALPRAGAVLRRMGLHHRRPANFESLLRSTRKNAIFDPGNDACLFRFPADMARLPAEVNQLNNQVLVRYFEAEWRKVSASQVVLRRKLTACCRSTRSRETVAETSLTWIRQPPSGRGRT